MRSKVLCVVELLLSALILVLLELFYFKVVKMAGIKISLDYALTFIKYLMAAIFITVLYRRYIKIKHHRIKNAKVNNIFTVILSVLLLIAVTIIAGELGNKFLDKTIVFPFMNYTGEKFELSLILKILTNSILLPYIFVLIFILGVGNNIKNPFVASLVSGILFMICYGYSLKMNLTDAFFISLLPGIIMAILSYLNKTNRNIWNIIIIYILYVSFGSLLINYIM